MKSAKTDTRDVNPEESCHQLNPKIVLSDGLDNNESESDEPESEVICGVSRSILEMFDELDWDVVDEQEYKDCHKWFLPSGYPSTLYTKKLLDSKLVPFPTKDYTIPPMSEEKEEIPIAYLPGLDGKYQPCLPAYSVLSLGEQRKLYQFYFRITYKKDNLTEQETVEFQELRQKVAKENLNFQELAKTNWIRNHWERTLKIPPEIQTFTDSLWMVKAGQCLSVYPDDYKTISQVPLTLSDPNDDRSVMEFVKCVYTKGWPVKMSLPSRKKPCLLPSKIEDLSRIKPISLDVKTRPVPLTQSILPASLDPVMGTLLEGSDLDVDVVMTGSGVKTLVDNYKFQKEWVLPIFVKEMFKSDGESVKKVVIIDKKLPPKYMSVHEKNIWHAKIVSKWALILNQYPNLLDKQEDGAFSKAKRNVTTYDDMLAEATEILDVNMTKKVEKNTEDEQWLPELLVTRESWPNIRRPRAGPSGLSSSAVGVKDKRKLTSYDDMLSEAVEKMSVENPSRSGKKSMEISSKVKESNISHKNPSSVKRPLNRSSEQNSLEARKVEQNVTSKVDSVCEDLELFGINSEPQRNNCSRSDTGLEGSATTKDADKHSSFNKTPEGAKGLLGKRKSTSFSSNESPINGNEKPVNSSLRRLSARARTMRAPCHHYNLWKLKKSKHFPMSKFEQRSLNVLVRTRKDGNLFHYQNDRKQETDVCVSSKLEFQPEYGASKMAVSELTREYVDLYLRPESKLARVRSIGHTKEVLITEVKTLAEVKERLLADSLPSQKIFNPLYAVLTKLIDLPPGRYMLLHTAKMGPFAGLLGECSGWMTFRLPEYFQELCQVDVSVPPMPIDPTVLTPLHHRDRLAPALFIPSCPSRTMRYFKKPEPSTPYRGRKRKNKKKKKVAK